MDNLKLDYPNIRILAFTTPYFKSLDSEAVDQSVLFSEWLSARKDWIIIGLHGLNHGFPPEYIRPFKEKCELIVKSHSMLVRFLPENWSAKAPGNKINEETVKILSNLGCRWIFLTDNVVYDTHVKRISRLNRVFCTHCNDVSFDSIAKIFPFLRKIFPTLDFINPEELNENFSNW